MPGTLEVGIDIISRVSILRRIGDPYGSAMRRSVSLMIRFGKAISSELLKLNSAIDVWDLAQNEYRIQLRRRTKGGKANNNESQQQLST